MEGLGRVERAEGAMIGEEVVEGAGGFVGRMWGAVCRSRIWGKDSNARGETFPRGRVPGLGDSAFTADYAFQKLKL